MNSCKKYTPGVAITNIFLFMELKYSKLYFACITYEATWYLYNLGYTVYSVNTMYSYTRQYSQTTYIVPDGTFQDCGSLSSIPFTSSADFRPLGESWSFTVIR